MEMDSVNQKLLARLQNGFPLTAEPFRELGRSLEIPEEEVIDRIERFRNEGIIRQISPVFDARSLGYRTTLTAVKVNEDRLEKAAQIIGQNPFISHAYEREHPFNLWFTLALPGAADIDAEMRNIAAAIPAGTIFHLPATKLYKIGAYFGAGDPEAKGGVKRAPGRLPQAVELSPEARAVINGVQRDLPLTPRPFAGMSEDAGMDEGRFLEQCRFLLERGIMRRYGAAVNHRRVGYTANAMACWAVPEDKADALGKRLASLGEVSHCYERKTSPEWPYNLFAMIHGHERESCQEIARRVSAGHGLNDYVLLFSTRELKKTRIKYQV